MNKGYEMDELKLNASDSGYNWGDSSLHLSNMRYLFECMIPEDGTLLDEEFGWILVKNNIIFPLGFERVCVGDGFGSNTGWSFEYKVLYRFNEDIMLLIKNMKELVKGKPRKEKQLYNLVVQIISEAISEQHEELLENLKEFK